MKKLYSCNAQCDINTLYSYTTPIITTYKDKVYMNCVRTNTTMSHIRKYAKWLYEMGQFEKSRIVSQLYRFCIDNKIRYAVYDNGRIMVDD